jgi:hypothetical protein
VTQLSAVKNHQKTSNAEKKKSLKYGAWGPFSPAGSQYIQGVSEIGGYILDTRSVDRNKEEIS